MLGNRGSAAIVGGMSLILLPACSSTGPTSSGRRLGQPRDERALLRQRADGLWDAKTKDEWDTIFHFEDPNSRRDWNKEEFIAWSEKNDPFKVLSFQLGDIQADGDLGWVEVKYNTLVRRFASLPPRDATLWQKWHKVDGTWHPVPLRDLVSYPEPPSRRDLYAEKHLRGRYLEYWDARKSKDIKLLHQYIDPYDQPRMPVESLQEMEGLMEYLSYDLKWVEVIGEMGRVHVIYRRKVTDPSLSKLPPETAVETEEWIRVNDEWYRDLSRVSGPGASQ